MNPEPEFRITREGLCGCAINFLTGVVTLGTFFGACYIGLCCWEWLVQ